MTEPEPAGEEAGLPKPLLVTSEDFAELQPEWRALHAAIPGATPFTHPDWHATWLRHFGADSLPVYLSFRRGEELAGVAALDLDRDIARTLGDPNVRDYGGPLALPGEESRVASALFEWLREDLTPNLELWGVPAGTAMHAALLSSGPDEGYAPSESPEANCPATALPGDWEAYLASLTKHDRHELRRKLRHLEAAGEVRYELLAGGEVAANIDELLRLMRVSHHHKDEFLTPVMEAFFRDLAAAFGANGLARLGRLTLDGRTAAMLFSFENEETVFLYNSGYEPDLSHLAVGLLSKALAIRDAIARGKRRFDFLRGDEDYKRHLGGEPAPVVTLRFAAPRP
ncbi:MAG: GNAT family N-acetyltransferase [Hyphomicrobiales bacterium]